MFNLQGDTSRLMSRPVMPPRLFLRIIWFIILSQTAVKIRIGLLQESADIYPAYFLPKICRDVLFWEGEYFMPETYFIS